jgi:hypothetical protein
VNDISGHADRFVTCAQVGTARKCAIMAYLGAYRRNTGNASREAVKTVPKGHTFRVLQNQYSAKSPEFRYLAGGHDFCLSVYGRIRDK